MKNSGISLLTQWGLVLLAFAAMIYAMIVIKEEKSSYEDEAIETIFGPFILLIPSWWGNIKSTNLFLEYQRTETRYKWFSRYEYIESSKERLDLDLAEYLNFEQIFFDEDETVFETNPEYFIKNREITNLIEAVIRVEGTATQHDNDRIYLDIIFMKLKDTSGFYIFQSHSSVLNGALEGPYFEETINQMKLK